MPKYGFSERPVGQSFNKEVPIGRWILHISFIDHESDFHVTADVAIRVNAVEDLVHRGLGSPTTRSRTATIGAELGNIADHRQRRWAVTRSEEINAVVEALVSEFKKFGLPYLQQYSDLKKMLDLLSPNDQSAWLHAPIHLRRCMSAVALAVVLKDPRAAEIARAGERFLLERKDPDLASFKEFVK